MEGEGGSGMQGIRAQGKLKWKNRERQIKRATTNAQRYDGDK
jgi:hypothetical protein